ncbi:MAG TPA: hypothetical protein VFQ77_16485 [Pseudonocardiaceae bacterium]|nr:hypothetical protein [Pseudonocardiaceae bacterium]
MPLTQASVRQGSVLFGQTTPHLPQLLRSVCVLTHWPTWGSVPPGHTVGAEAGHVQALPVEQVAPVGQQRLPQTRLFGQQNLSVPGLVRHV